MSDSKKVPHTDAALGITKENLLFARPVALRGDESAEALAAATAEMLAARLAEIDRLRIISNIDNLEEALLDILAYDFKVDWWDTAYSLEEKRKTLKSNWVVHRTLGTKAAVETAISAIYPETRVLEWFDYGGKPYHFKLLLDVTYEKLDPEKHARVLERLECYKNLRSVLDTVEYYEAGASANAWTACAFLGASITDSAAAVQY